VRDVQHLVFVAIVRLYEHAGEVYLVFAEQIDCEATFIRHQLVAVAVLSDRDGDAWRVEGALHHPAR
jgi:hypothetical protein